MAEAFIGEIRMCGFNFAPRGWAFCNGQILPIAQNTALFSLLGTQYGGDGRTTFALPNLQGRFPIAAGQGPGLSMRTVGESGGVGSVTLNSSQMPAHTHVLQAAAGAATDSLPSPDVTFAATASARIYGPLSAPVGMGVGTIGTAGNGLPHNNLQPYLALNYVIALQGIFPPRG